jgi:4-amino-4-deoxy-L-arabinose transferase-like glycosyltransferase
MISARQSYLAPPQRAALLIFVATVLVHALFWLILPESLSANQSADFRAFYEPVARNILRGEGLVLANGQLAVRYPPGYPILLAAVFGLAQLTGAAESTVLSLFLLFCLGGTAVFIYLLARELWGHGWSYLPALAWITYPFALWLGKQPNSEIPFLVLFHAGFYIFWRIITRPAAWYTCLLCGLLWGSATLIRPAAVGLPILLAIILWFTQSSQTVLARLRAVVLLFAGTLALVLPWEGWVYAHSGTVIILSRGGAASMRDGLTFAANDKGYREEIVIPANVQLLTHDLLAQAQRGHMEQVGEILAVLQEELKARPLTVASLYLFKAWRSWYATDSGRFELPSMILQSLYLVAIVSGSWQSWRQGGARRQMVVIVWLITAYFWLMTIAVLSILRYMLPALGLLFLLLPGNVVHDDQSPAA